VDKQSPAERQNREAGFGERPNTHLQALVRGEGGGDCDAGWERHPGASFQGLVEENRRLGRQVATVFAGGVVVPHFQSRKPARHARRRDGRRNAGEAVIISTLSCVWVILGTSNCVAVIIATNGPFINQERRNALYFKRMDNQRRYFWYDERRA